MGIYINIMKLRVENDRVLRGSSCCDKPSQFKPISGSQMS